MKPLLCQLKRNWPAAQLNHFTRWFSKSSTETRWFLIAPGFDPQAAPKRDSQSSRPSGKTRPRLVSCSQGGQKFQLNILEKYLQILLRYFCSGCVFVNFPCLPSLLTASQSPPCSRIVFHTERGEQHKNKSPLLEAVPLNMT